MISITMILIFDLDDTLYDEINYVKSGFKEVSIHIFKKFSINKIDSFEFMMNELNEKGRGKVFNALLEEYGIYDSCGVNNLHGIPGIIGGLGGFISASLADDTLYGDNISTIFPGRANGRTAVEQGLYQLAALATTLGISVCGGLITGYIVKLLPEADEYFEDEQNWEYEEVEKKNDNLDEANINNTL